MKNSKNSEKNGVIGIDEVGRGPLAGPVTVCAVYVENVSHVKRVIFHGIVRDSKKISKILRNKIYITITKKRYLNTSIKYSICSRSANYIDKYGIQKATQWCVDSCLESLEEQGVKIESVKVHTDAGLLASNKKLQQKSFIKGDEKFTEIALASILAKESRDKYMKSKHKAYPNYFWDKNVGYGTKDHQKSIQKFGITKIHRKSYIKGF